MTKSKTIWFLLKRPVENDVPRAPGESIPILTNVGPLLSTEAVCECESNYLE